jgi:glycosyltransferase 2 family protein
MAQTSRASHTRAAARAAATLALSGLCVGYIVWRIDLRRTADIVGHAHPVPLVAATLIWLIAVWPLAWRWQRLLRARGVEAPIGWLVRTYFVSYGAGQLLPTSLGGDATRIYSGTRRYRGEAPAIVGSVLMERILGGAATLLLAAIGLALAFGSVEIGPYLWIELLLVVGTVAIGTVLFSRRIRRSLARLGPLLRRFRAEAAARTLYDGLHGYREHRTVLVEATVISVLVQAARILGIWLVGKSVGVDVSPRPYYVFGPLLFLVMLVPFTINGLAVREAMFVNFLGQLGIGANPAFATGFLFFLLSIVVSLPGAAIVGLELAPGRLRNSRLQTESGADDREQIDRGRDPRVQRGKIAPGHSCRDPQLR